MTPTEYEQRQTDAEALADTAPAETPARTVPVSFPVSVSYFDWPTAPTPTGHDMQITGDSMFPASSKCAMCDTEFVGICAGCMARAQSIVGATHSPSTPEPGQFTACDCTAAGWHSAATNGTCVVCGGQRLGSGWREYLASLEADRARLRSIHENGLCGEWLAECGNRHCDWETFLEWVDEQVGMDRCERGEGTTDEGL